MRYINLRLTYTYLHSVYCTVFLYISDRICSFLHCALAVAQCVVIGFVCLWVGECVWVCYHNKTSKVRASILTKLDL